MQNSNREQVREIFFDALEVETHRREHFLDKRCGADVELRGEIEGLLEEHFEIDDIFDQPVFEAAKLFDENSERHFGKYKIVREIGAGGTGTVFLAERDDGEFEQKVAIKVARQVVADAHTVKRFMFERQILASLNHPFIAKLYDGGISDKGSPFLIMEYIEAVSITDFADEHDLTIKERLELFVKVCEGVTFAHRNLIVHRDIKPSNILVTKNGTPKLLDFGLAKLLETDLGETSTKTATIFQALTPAYASPEQIQGKPITTATDIYSLGIVLYELLTGNRPYSFANKNLSDILQTLEHSKITPPSEALSPKSKVQSPKSENQETNPKSKIQNPKSLKGDLDTIILKALRREPEQRYGSVEKFAEDISRYLNGLPITARPATFLYQTDKFYQRNKIVVLASVFIILSLLTGITVAIWQANVAREQARIAFEMRSQAELEAEKVKSEEVKAKKISDFTAKVFSYANPAWYAEGAKFGGNTRVIDAMEDLSDKIDIEFADEPDVAAELHHRFTEAFGANAKSMKSEEQRERILFHARRALELRKRFYGERHELVAKDMVYLYWAGGVEESQQANYLMSAIQMMRETNPNNLNLPYMLEAYSSQLMMPDTPQTHEAYRQAVTPPTDENKYQIAERYLREALPIFHFHYKEDNIAIFANECRLAYVLLMQENQKDLEEHFTICKQGKEKLKSGDLAARMRKNVEIVEQASDKKNIAK